MRNRSFRGNITCIQKKRHLNQKLHQVKLDKETGQENVSKTVVEHVVLLQATLPETEQCPYSEVEALC